MMGAKLPSGIRQRGTAFIVDVSWEGRRLTATCHHLEEAIKKRTELLHMLQNGNLPEPEAGKRKKVWTLGEAYDRTLANRWKGSKAEVTAEKNGLAIVTYFGRARKLDTIDADEVDGWIAHLLRIGNSNGTVNRKLACLSTMMTTAMERDGLDAKPKMARRKEHQGRIRFLTVEEEQTALTLLTQWERYDAWDAVSVLLDSGLRRGELNKIEVRDCDFRTKMLSVWENKGDLPRSVPMTKRVVDILSRRAIVHKTKLFPYQEQWLRHTWDRLRETMGLGEDEQFVIHACRHTFASRLIQRGVNLRVVQQLMGHKTLEMTMRYAHLAPGNLQAAVALLEPAPAKVE